jgi:hypothetical protein
VQAELSYRFSVSQYSLKGVDKMKKENKRGNIKKELKLEFEIIVMEVF